MEQLTPPEVGAAEASSAMDMPIQRIKRLATAHWRDGNRSEHVCWAEREERTNSTSRVSCHPRLGNRVMEEATGTTERPYAPPTPLRRDHHLEWSKRGRSCM